MSTATKIVLGTVGISTILVVGIILSFVFA